MSKISCPPPSSSTSKYLNVTPSRKDRGEDELNNAIVNCIIQLDPEASEKCIEGEVRLDVCIQSVLSTSYARAQESSSEIL